MSSLKSYLKVVPVSVAFLSAAKGNLWLNLRNSVAGNLVENN